MLIGAILLGLLLGLAAGGSIWNLASVRLNRVSFLLLAVVVRFATEAAISNNVPLAETLRLPLYGGAYLLLLAGLWANREQPGMSLAFVGILGNTLAIVANFGHMPIWEPSLQAAGLTAADVHSAFHSIIGPDLNAEFLLHVGPLGDIIPIPFPIIRNVASVGDLFLSAGLAFFLFATTIQTQEELQEVDVEVVNRRLAGLAATARLPQRRPTFGETRVRPETGLSAAMADVVVDRPVMFGSDAPGTTTPALAPLAMELDIGADGAAVAAPAIPRAIPALVERARRNPYAQLALNGTFSSLWTAQVISLFGDRVHQVALAFVVLGITNSPLATAGVFIAATLPNLLFSPIAGTFVDRWDHREVMIVSDILRAALVLLVPIVAIVSPFLTYPVTFLVTTISIFFRPARIAALPRIVREDQLVTANSATWLAETLADVVGYPLAGLFVGFLGHALSLAFWLDSATYLASAALLWTIVIPSVARQVEERATRTGFLTELREGWAFLRGQTLLLANTGQAVVGQFTLGALIALTPVYARDAVTPSGFDVKAVYAFLETGIGVGNLIGGFVIGLIGARLAKGHSVILGYVGAGLAVTFLGFASQLPLVLGLMVGLGIANMVFVIPSQTLFQQSTPPEFMGRVLGIRFALVFGSMTLAMAVGGVLGEAFGAAPVIGALGAVTLVAGIAGSAIPAVRDA